MDNSLQPHAEKINSLFRELEIMLPDYDRLFTPHELSKGEFLLQEGTVCNSFWKVQKGVLRCFYRKQESEVVTYFWFPGDFVYSTQSYLLQAPCKDNIQALTDSEVYAMGRHEFEELCSKLPIVSEIRNMMLEMHVMWLEERLLTMQCLSARERYEKLLQTDPQLMLQIPLTHIASYLGVTTETLCRIRAGILKKKR